MKIKHLLYGLAGALLLLLLIILLPIDDELDPEAAAWIQAANDTQDVPGNAYYYLMGIAAAADEDPAAAGKALIEDYRRAEQAFLKGGLEEFPYPDYTEKLQLPEGEYYCLIREPGCFPRLASGAAALRAELETHAVLLERYQRYLRFDMLKFLVEPGMYEPLPHFLYILRGNKLNQFRIVAARAAGKRELALSLLHEDMRALRRRLADAPNLISKMIALNMLADNLDLLLQIEWPAEARAPLIQPLTAQERSLGPAMMREFGSIANFHRQLEAYPRSLYSSLDPSEWLLLATIKSNMSLNGLFPYYHGPAELSLAEAPEFRRIIETAPPEAEIEFNLRNIGGWVLGSVSMPSLVEYPARLHDLDCKIALVNAALPLDGSAWQEVIGGTRALAAANPYNPAEQPYIDKEAQALCFNGPLPDEQKRRCIRKDGMPSLRNFR